MIDDGPRTDRKHRRLRRTLGFSAVVMAAVTIAWLVELITGAHVHAFAIIIGCTYAMLTVVFTIRWWELRRDET